MLRLSRAARTTVCSIIRNQTGSTEPRYAVEFRRSIERPEEFWGEHAEKLSWFKRWDKVLDNSRPPFSQWFVGGQMNTCYNAVDRHVENGLGNQVAIIHNSPVTNSVQTVTYLQLLDKVSRFARVLSNLGVGIGDRVIIYMPMIPESIFVMLACARIGAIHSLVFGGFSAHELGVRIRHAKPKVVVTANYAKEPTHLVPYKPVVDEAIHQAGHKPKAVVVFNRPQFEPTVVHPPHEVDFCKSIADVKPIDPVSLDANHPVYMLYTSGTTGEPKAVVRPSGGYAVALHWSMNAIFGMRPGEVWWAASDLGWVVGHSYICYGPLLHGNTTLIFEGKPVGTPDAGEYFRVIKQHDVAGMFAAPTALRAIRKIDPDGNFAKQFRSDKFRYLFVAGEYCDKVTQEWAIKILERPVYNNFWQTETGWPVTAPLLGLGDSAQPPAGTAGRAVPGWDLKVFHRTTHELVPTATLGRVGLKVPLPPGALSTLWNADERFCRTYFSSIPGYYDTMDAGFVNKDGYVGITSREDDVINVAGHRLSSGHLEEAVLNGLPDLVVEAAVVGLDDPIKGHVPMAFCVLKNDNVDHSQLTHLLREALHDQIGHVAILKLALAVQKLPKTRSGKVARNTLANMINGLSYKIPSTIEDASVYKSIAEVVTKAGLQPGQPA